MPITGLTPLKFKLCDAAKIRICFLVPYKTRVIKDFVLSKIPYTILTISQAPEGVFDETLCQNLALENTRLSRFNGNII
jgi:hypothetical protein